MIADEAVLSNYLVQKGKLDSAALLRAQALCENGRRRLPSVLLHLGLIQENELASAFSECLHLPLIKIDEFPDGPVLEKRLRGTFLKKVGILPISENENGLLIAMTDPLDDQSLRAVRLATDMSVTVGVAESTLIERAITSIYFAEKETDSSPDVSEDAETILNEDIEKLKGLASEAPVIRLVNSLINDAVEVQASDIHIEPSEHQLGLRFRLDGRLVEQAALPAEQTAALVSRIKIMAKLNIAERRLPQDGRVQTAVRGRIVDLRISTMPTMHGESVVIRILDRENVPLEFGALGIDKHGQKLLGKILERPNGIVLVTGPTGSGKTTTLYTALATLRRPEVNILTVEDPVEYQLPGIKQIQIKPSIGLDFAQVLRSMLRHDPDIILVGEIRDKETANIAIQAAFTGHLVLSTLHTNDAASSITRLLDMGLESYLLTSSIVGVVAQRLVRRLCPNCKIPISLDQKLAEQLNITDDQIAGGMGIFQAVGCSACRNTGYCGRILIMEVMPMSPSISAQVLRGSDAPGLQRAACADGMRTLFEDGLIKMLDGHTTLDEVLRVTQDMRFHSQIGTQLTDMRSENAAL